VFTPPLSKSSSSQIVVVARTMLLLLLLCWCVPRTNALQMAPWKCLQCTDVFKRNCELALHVRSKHRDTTRSGPSQEPFPGTLVFEDTEYPSGAGGGEDEHLEVGATEPGEELCSPAELLRARLMELYANGNKGSGLSDSDMTTVLSILREALTVGLDVSELFSSTDALVVELARLSKESPELLWYATEVQAPSFPGLPPTKLLYRKIDAVVRHYVATHDLLWGAWKPQTTSSGERLYDHPCASLWMEAVHEYLRERAHHLSPLPVQFWSDKASLTEHGRVSYHPLNMVFLSGQWGATRDQWPLAQVAFLPILSRSDYPTLSDDEWHMFQAELLHESMRRVLFPALDIGDLRHNILCVERSGEERHVLLLAHSWAADFEEQLMLAALIGRTMCCMCDITKEEVFHIASGRPKPRSELWMVNNLELMGSAKSQARFHELRRETRLQGVTPILLDIFQRGITGRLVKARLLPSWVVPASLMPFDMLHVFDEGLFKYYVQCCITAHLDRTYGKRCGVWLTDTIALRFKRLIRSAYVEDVRWPSDWYRVVRGGKKALPCSGLQAGEMRALFQILPLVLPGILGERGESTGRWTACAAQADYLTSFFVSVQRHYYELRRYNRPAGGHTDRTIQTLEHGASRIQDMLQAYFAGDQKSDFKLPKTHAGYGPHVGDHIRLLGSPRRYMTEFGEGSVKTGNAAYQGTNKQHRSAAEQMATILTFRTAAATHLNALGGSTAPTGLGTRLTAKRKSVLTSANCLASSPIATLELSAFGNHAAVPALQGRAGMDGFVQEFRDYYAHADEVVPSRIEIVNSAAVAGNQAHHANNPVHTVVTQTIYATPNFRGHKRFSFVALEGTQSERLGQVQLLFRTPEDGFEHACVRYLMLDVSRWDPQLGNDQPDPLFGSGCTPLVWAKGKFAFEVVLLSLITRREFIFPDVRGVYAPPPSNRRVKAASRTEDDSSESGGDDEEEEGSDEEMVGEDDEGEGDRLIRASCFLYENDGGERFWEAPPVSLDS